MNKNTHNHNGKEVHRDQSQKNLENKGDMQSTDRIKKKHTGREKEINPGEPRKNPINVNKANRPNVSKSSANPNKNVPKGQVIKLGNKEKGIHPVDSPIKKSPVQVHNTIRTSPNGKTFTNSEPTSNVISNDNPKFQQETKDSNYSPNTATYLYVIAAVLLLAWIVGFFFYKLDANIHMLLALAIIIGVISFLQGRKK